MFLEIALAMSSAVGGACSATDGSNDDHLMDVCDSILVGGPAYSATFQASLSPAPASQQVTIYRLDGNWFMWVAGYRWEEGGAIATRRDDIQISDEDAQSVVDLMTMQLMARLQSLPYYGQSEDGSIIVCTDGASYTVELVQEGQRYVASQHSCAGKTELNQTMALFRSLALKYDPQFDGLLAGLKAE